MALEMVCQLQILVLSEETCGAIPRYRERFTFQKTTDEIQHINQFYYTDS